MISVGASESKLVAANAAAAELVEADAAAAAAAAGAAGAAELAPADAAGNPALYGPRRHRIDS